MDSDKRSVLWAALVTAAPTVLLASAMKVGFCAHALLFIAWIPVAAWMLRRREARAGRGEVPAADPAISGERRLAFVLLAGLALWMIVADGGDRWFGLPGWLPEDGRGWTLRIGAARFALGALLLSPLLWSVRPGRRASVVAGLVLAGTMVLSLAALLHTTGGAPLYRDDHPSFMFRLHAFARSFPHLVFYDPFWNGGRSETVILSSGVTLPGLLLWPLWRAFPVDQVYTLGLGLLFLVVVPLLAVGATRLTGGGWLAAAAAGVLSLSATRMFPLWALHFGTVGACFTGAFIMPLAAGLQRALGDERPGWTTGLVVVLSSVAFLSWPGAVMMALPVALGVMAAGRAWTLRRLRFLVICAVAVLVLSLPFVSGLLLHSQAVSYAAMDSAATPWTDDLRRGLEELAQHLFRAHPLVLFLGLAGALVLPIRGPRAFWAGTLGGLLILSAWGETWKPQLQLSRAAIPLMWAATVPAALVIERLFSTPDRWLAPVRAALLVLLALSGLGTIRTYANRGPADYAIASPEMPEVVAWIRAHVPENGRLLFAGPTVHAYGRGHVAYLPVWTGRSMIACDYYHFSPKRVEYECPPRAWREEPEDVRAYLEIYNVTHVMTYHDHWKKFFRGRPAEYREVVAFGEGGKRAVFEVLRSPNWFAGASGSVRPDIGRLRVRLDRADTACLLKFNWVDGMRAEPPVRIAPHDAGRGVRLIRIEPGGRGEFDITWRPSLLPSFDE